MSTTHRMEQRLRELRDRHVITTVEDDVKAQHYAMYLRLCRVLDAPNYRWTPKARRMLEKSARAVWADSR